MKPALIIALAFMTFSVKGYGKEVDFTENIRSVYFNADTLFDVRVKEIMNERDVEKKEILYKNLLKEFPGNAPEYAEGYIRLQTSMALSWAGKGDTQKVMAYYRPVKGKITTAYPLSFALNLVKNKQYETAVEILDEVKQQVYDESSLNEGKLYTFLRTYTTLAEALHALGKDDEALKVIELAYDKSDKTRESINSIYAAILHSLGKHEQALPLMEDLVAAGVASDHMKELFKQSYIAVHKNSSGFNELMNSLNDRLLSDMVQAAGERMLSVPASDFNLKDMKGKTVSLSSLKGKIVVLDFWATWCIPCIKSLPAMQKARDHFGKNSDVVFLFVNTSEDIPDRKKKVKSFLKDNKFDLRVLLDEKQSGSTRFTTASAYRVNGIPVKFIIDADGIIRYRVTGFSGGEDATVAELIAMITKVKEKQK